MPSFITVGYVWRILGRRGEKRPPIREQPRKSPSWIGLRANESNFTWERFLSQTFIHPECQKTMVSALLVVVMTGQTLILI